MTKQLRTHWSIELEKHPIARLIVPCFVPPGRELRDVVDHVEIGRSSLKIVFKIGQRHQPIPFKEDSLTLRMLFALEKEFPEHNFQVTYDTVESPGIYARLAVIVEWSEP